MSAPAHESDDRGGGNNHCPLLAPPQFSLRTLFLIVALLGGLSR